LGTGTVDIIGLRSGSEQHQ